MRLTADYLRSLPADEVKDALGQLTSQQVKELQYDWSFWARDKQLPPKGKDWFIWFINAGRYFGKTRTGAEWVRSEVKKGVKDIAIVGRTSAETADVCLYGKSGLLNVCSPYDKTNRGAELGIPTYNKNEKKLKWANGAVAKLFSAEEPEAPRGSQFEIAWLDELGSWSYQQEMWDQLMFCMRLGKQPRVTITTTPRSTPLIRDLFKRDNVVLTTGNTYENTNMPKNFRDEITARYEGTRLGRQEIYAEVLTENEGALWTADMIDACQVSRDEVPELVRKVVSVDPAVSSNVESDSTGIVVAGIDINGKAYVLGDYTFKASPETWANRVVELYHSWECSRIVYESNQGKDLIPSLFKTVDENLPLKGVHASSAKIARAEPVSALYEQGKVFHVRNPEDPDASLTDLETQMTTYEPMGKHKSPDRYDACLAAGTMVTTEGGDKPIESVVVGDKVKTRGGYKPVVWSGMTRHKSKTLDIELSNGSTVKATKEHPFYIKGFGWLQAMDLKAGDSLVSQEELDDWLITRQKLSSTETLIEDTQIHLIKQNKGTTSLRQEKDIGLCTGPFGSFITGPYHKATTSTTRMETTSTTLSRTLSAFHPRNTPKNMLASFEMLVENTWKTLGTWLLSGTVLQRGISFTSGWGRWLGKDVNLSMSAPVATAGFNSSLSSQAQCSVVKFAENEQKTALKGITLQKSAQCADQTSSKTSTVEHLRHAPVSVVRVSESETEVPTYNLHVEGYHEFMACGILTHNCVWALTELMLKGISRPTLRLSYSSADSLSQPL